MSKAPAHLPETKKTSQHMRTLLNRTPLMLAALLTLSAVCAAPPADPLRIEKLSPMERELKKQIDRFVTYPLLENRRNMDGLVEVSFVINAEGKVNVISAEGSDPELRTYVLRKLSKVDVGDNPSGTWRTEHMRFVFRPEA
jgi:outer membrane biosynthesis protein TonB